VARKAKARKCSAEVAGNVQAKRKQKAKRLRETRARDGMMKGKSGGKKARSWKPKREPKYNIISTNSLV